MDIAANNFRKYLLGFDIGSSSVKVSIIDCDTGELVSTAFSPKEEMKIKSTKIGWAEQNPEEWWKHLIIAANEALGNLSTSKYEIEAIGISYQMHGLVTLDKQNEILHPAIIWCDSRAVEIGDKALTDIGNEYLLSNLLNSPGNFTASKIKWLKENEQRKYDNISKVMLPGDYIAYKLTNEIRTTIPGLSEGIMWNFKDEKLEERLLEYFGISKSIIPELVPTFGFQGKLSKIAAEKLGLKSGIPITYRAGDQPNNAFSLNVLNPGEIAATAGTSGVVYGIDENKSFDKQSRVNSFAHVNYTSETPYNGVLLCINGTGILYNWVKNELFQIKDSYDELNNMARKINIGSDGVTILPFGNGSERVLNNKNVSCQFSGINFNNHSRSHLLRAAQEGIAFSFEYGINIMKDMGMDVNLLRAGNANMFQSDVFTEAIANTSEVTIELYNTDGAQGAARGAGVGSGFYESYSEAFLGLKKIKTIEPEPNKVKEYKNTYSKWEEILSRIMR